MECRPCLSRCLFRTAAHLGKIRRGQVDCKSAGFRVVMWDQGMGIHREAKALSRNLGEKHSYCGNLKSLFHLLLPFPLCWGRRSHVAGGSLTNWHLPLCLRPEESSEERRKAGKLKKSFSPTFCNVSSPWELGFDAWGVRGARGAPDSRE